MTKPKPKKMKKVIVTTSPNDLMLIAQRNIDVAKSTLAKFVGDLTSYPGSAFEWGDSAVNAAAVVSVWSDVLGAVTSGNRTTPQIRAEYTARVLSNSIHRTKSTSQCDNLLQQCKLAEMAEVVEAIRDIEVEVPEDSPLIVANSPDPAK